MNAHGGPDEELRWVKRPDGAHRSRSAGTPGYERDLLRDRSGNLLGPSESRAASIDDLLRSNSRSTACTDFRQRAAEAVVDEAISALTPYVKRAVEYGVDSGVDGVMRLVGWARRKVAERKASTSNDVSSKLVGPDEAIEVVEAELLDEAEPGIEVDEVTPPISGEEYRARFLAALAAERYAAEEKRRLASVNIADDALSPELRAALRSALGQPASSLDEETLAAVVEFLDGSHANEGPYLLLPAGDADRLGENDES